MRAPIRLLTLSAILAVPACGDPSSSNNNTSSDLGLPSADLSGGGDLADDLYRPAGYTLVPFLSEEPQRSFAQAEMVLDQGKDYRAVIETDVGRMVMDLYEVDTPITVNSFVFLARQHFFEGIAFHRVIEDFMAQSGDPNTIEGAPSSWGYGGPGYEFVNEIDASLTFADTGVLAMANSGADTNGSQFFLTFGAAPFLDGDYTIFGRVIEGASVLGTIARGEPPASPTRITSVQILQR